jgi:hypothetical protein
MATSNPHFFPPLTMASGPDGSVTMINIFVDPSNAKQFIDLAASLRKSYLKEPECLFCEISQHPQDPGHIRVTQGWTRDSEWFLNVSFCVSYCDKKCEAPRG